MYMYVYRHVHAYHMHMYVAADVWCYGISSYIVGRPTASCAFLACKEAGGLYEAKTGRRSMPHPRFVDLAPQTPDNASIGTLVVPGYIGRLTLTRMIKTLVRQNEMLCPGWQGAVRLSQSSCRHEKTRDKLSE